MENNTLKQQVIESIDPKEHVLLFPQMYVGAMQLMQDNGYLYNTENNNFSYISYEYVPGLLKIINEIIDNSIDEFIRTNEKYSNKILIELFEDHINIYDNGRGLPLEIDKKSNLPMGVKAFVTANTGGNFRIKNRNGIGMHGLGAFLTNVLSNKFNVITINNGNECLLECNNNLNKYKYSISKSNKKSGTIISFYPDFKRFSLLKLDKIYEDLIISRLYSIATTYNSINFVIKKIDGKKIIIKNFSYEKYFSLFSDNKINYIQDKYAFCIIPNDLNSFNFSSYVNGLNIKNGGKNIDYILDKIVENLYNIISKKYKNIKKADIKNKLTLISIIKDLNNAQFDSQSKEKITNSIKEIELYYNISDKDFDNISKLIKNNEIIYNDIINDYKIREEFEKVKNLKKIDSENKTKNIINNKYMSASKKKEFLGLCEGDSATSQMAALLGRENWGWYSLGGCPNNVWNKDELSLSKSPKFNDLIKIIGIKLSSINQNKLIYDKIVITTDADVDGYHFRGLLLGLFYKFTDIIQQGKLYILETPIAVARKGNKKILIDTYDDMKKLSDDYIIDYKKGLASWDDSEFSKLIDNDINKYLYKVNYDENLEKKLLKWLSDDTSDERKEDINNCNFDLSIY